MHRTDADRRVPLPRSFHRLLIAWFASVTGDGIRFAAIPLLALSLKPSAGAVSAVATAMTLPWLLVALPAGALVDRLDPAKVISTANGCRAVTAAGLVVVILTGKINIPLLSAAGFLLTAAETFTDSAAQSLLIRIVPSEQLERANARFISSENVGLDLVGPLLAGALFVAAHWIPFALVATIFVGTAGWVLTLTGHRDRDVHPGHGVEQPTADHAQADAAGKRLGAAQVGPTAAREEVAPAATASATGMASDRVSKGPRMSVLSAVRAIAGSPDLRTLVFTVAVTASAIAAAEGLLVLYSTSSLRLSQALYPTLLACYSVGLLAAAALIGRRPSWARPGPAMLAAILVIGSTLLAMGLFPRPAVAWSCFLLMGAAGGVWNVLSATYRQRRTPSNMVARVSSTFRAIAWGALPVGTALGGVAGNLWGVPKVFVLSGLVVLALAGVMGRFFLFPRGRSSAGIAPRGNHPGPATEPI